MGSSNTSKSTQGTGTPIVSAEAMRDMLSSKTVSLALVEETLIAMIDSGKLEEEQGKSIMRTLFLLV